MEMSPWRRTDGWTFNGNLIFGIYWNEYRAIQSVDNVRLSFAILVGNVWSWGNCDAPNPNSNVSKYLFFSPLPFPIFGAMPTVCKDKEIWVLTCLDANGLDFCSFYRESIQHQFLLHSLQHPLYLRQRIEQAPLLTDETTLPNVNKRGLEVSNMVPCASPLKREVKPERCTMWRQQHQDAPSNKQRKCYLSLFKQILGTIVCFNLDPYPTLPFHQKTIAFPYKTIWQTKDGKHKGGAHGYLILLT